jgi:hypothetical protein
MKRTALLFAAAILLWATSARADEVVRSFRQQVSVGSAGEVSLDFPVGQVTVEAWDNPQVDVDVKLACNHRATSRCLAAAKAVRLIYNASGNRLRVYVKDWPKLGGAKGLHVIARISMPRDLALQADLGVGELNVHGTAGDLTVDLGVGEVNVTLPKEAIASVDLDAGVGEATLVAAGKRYENSGLFVRELHWDKGTGHSEVSVDCGVGEIDVVLK